MSPGFWGIRHGSHCGATTCEYVRCLRLSPTTGLDRDCLEFGLSTVLGAVAVARAVVGYGLAEMPKEFGYDEDD